MVVAMSMSRMVCDEKDGGGRTDGDDDGGGRVGGGDDGGRSVLVVATMEEPR